MHHPLHRSLVPRAAVVLSLALLLTAPVTVGAAGEAGGDSGREIAPAYECARALHTHAGPIDNDTFWQVAPCPETPDTQTV